MYPRNAASPERVALGQVILIADGTVQSSGVAVTVRGQGGAEAASAGTIAFGAENTVYYTPTQAETNFSSFVLIASKASCFSASITIITTASATAGKVVLSGETHTSAVIPTVTTLTGHTAQTGDSFARIGATGSGLTSLATQASVDAVDNFIDTEISDIQSRLPAALVGGRIDSSVGAVAANAITASAIADGAIDRATFAADTGLVTVRSNTAQAGAATTITLDAAASAVTDFYKNALIVLTGGTGVGQGRYITAYNGTTKVATVSAWATNPDVTSTFAIIAADAIVGATAPTAVQVADEVQTRTIAAVTVVNGLAANVITAAATAADFTTEIQAGLATAAALTVIDDFLDTEVAAIKAKTDLIPAAPAAVGDIPTAIQNADTLLDRNMATGTDSGSPTVRTVRQALRFLRNKWSISAGTLTVTKEDDATASFTATVTTDAAAVPIIGNDPA